MKTRFPAGWFLLGLVIAAGLCVAPAFSHVPQYSVPTGGGAPVPDHWDMSSFPVVWQVNTSVGSNISGASSVSDVMDASFASWLNAPNAAIHATRGSDTGDSAPGFDGGSSRNINLVCFVCTSDFTRD